MMADTVTLPGNRQARIVPGDEAGEFRLEVSEYLIAHLRDLGILTPDQCATASYMAELYGKGGGKMPHTRGDGGSKEPCPDAKAEFDALMALAPKQSQWPILVLCMGEWPHGRNPVPLWREGLGAIGKRLWR
jgi:hypothetical protein